MSFKSTVIPIIFVPTTTEPLTINPPAYQMDPILEYLFKIAPVVGVMGLWIFHQHKQLVTANKTIEKQHEDYKVLLEKMVEVNTKVLENNENLPQTIKQEIKGLKNFIELKMAEFQKEK